MIFAGCSYTWGDELENRLEERFIHHVSKHYKCEVTDLSQCGASNDFIVNSALHEIKTNGVQPTVLQLTVPTRIEFYAEDGPHLFCPYRFRQDNSNFNFRSGNKKKVPHSLAMSSYYRWVWNKTHGGENLYKNLLIFEQFAKVHSVPYIVLFNDCDPLEDLGYWRNLMDDAKMHHIYEDILQIIQTPGQGHPNADQHKIIADYIIEHTNF